jgi:hypothetical protein
MTSLVWPESSIVKPTTCRIPQHCLKVWRCEVYLCSRHSTVPHVNQYLLAMELGLWNSLELDDLTLTVNDYGTCPIQKSLYSSKKKWLPTQSGDLHGDSQAKAAIFSDFLAQHGDFQTTSLQFELSKTCCLRRRMRRANGFVVRSSKASNV